MYRSRPRSTDGLHIVVVGVGPVVVVVVVVVVVMSRP